MPVEFLKTTRTALVTICLIVGFVNQYPDLAFSSKLHFIIVNDLKRRTDMFFQAVIPFLNL